MIASPPISLPSTEIQSSPPCHLTLFIIHTVCNILQRRNSLSQHKIPRQQGTTRRGTLERGEKLLDMHAPISESVNPKEATSNTARVSYSSFLSFWHARMPRQCEYDYSTYSKQSIKFRKALFARQGLEPWAVVGATSINSTN